MKEQKTKAKVKAKAKTKPKTKIKKASPNIFTNIDELVSLNANDLDVVADTNITKNIKTDSNDFINLDELIDTQKNINISETPSIEKVPDSNKLHTIDELTNTNSNSLYVAIYRIQDTPILRDIKGFYEYEYNNLLTYFGYINKKTSRLFETSVITLAIFAVYIIYLFTQKYFATLSYVQIIFVLPLEIGVVLLIMSVYQNFKLQSTQTYFRKIGTNYPLQKAYEEIKVEAKREKEFLVRMVYNYATIVKENTQSLNDQMHMFKWQYNYFLTTIAVTFISLALIILN